MRKSLFLLLMVLTVIPVQQAFAAPDSMPVLVAQEGSSNLGSGGDTSSELQTYLDKELAAMKVEIAMMRQEIAAMKFEMMQMRKQFSNRKR